MGALSLPPSPFALRAFLLSAVCGHCIHLLPLLCFPDPTPPPSAPTQLSRTPFPPLLIQLFDNAGKARFQEESSSTSSREGYTMCSLLFAPYEVRCV